MPLRGGNRLGGGGLMPLGDDKRLGGGDKVRGGLGGFLGGLTASTLCTKSCTTYSTMMGFIGEHLGKFIPLAALPVDMASVSCNCSDTHMYGCSLHL